MACARGSKDRAFAHGLLVWAWGGSSAHVENVAPKNDLADGVAISGGRKIFVLARDPSLTAEKKVKSR